MKETIKGQKTKDKLVQAAIELFHVNGIHWVSFQQIAKVVGLSQPALYKHFQDKDDLIKQCALFAADHGRMIIDQNIDPRASAKEQIASYVEGNFLWLKDYPKEATIILAIHYFGFNHKSIQDLLIAINNQSVDRLSLRIERGIQENLWNVKNPRVVARIIHDLLFGEIFKAAHAPDEFPFKERVNIVCQAAMRLLIGTN